MSSCVDSYRLQNISPHRALCSHFFLRDVQTADVRLLRSMFGKWTTFGSLVASASCGVILGASTLWEAEGMAEASHTTIAGVRHGIPGNVEFIMMTVL